MSYLSAIFLGLVQGIAEFLPISSSGHLSIFQNFFGLSGIEEGGHVVFDILLHLATLVAVCIFYRRDIAAIITEGIDYVKSVGHPVPGEKKRYPAVRLLVMMFFGTLPLFVILPFKDAVETLYNNTGFIGAALIFCGFLLFFSDRLPRGHKTEKNMRIRDALVIGAFQAIATVPGLSRSGCTISAGMAVGFQRKFAVRYSFLMSLPAVLGATILEVKDVAEMQGGLPEGMLPKYLLGMVIAGVVGYFSIRLVNLLASKGKFGSFAYYCWAAGLISLILNLMGWTMA